MIIGLALIIYFILAIYNILVGIKPNNPYNIRKIDIQTAIIVNIILTVIFITILFKQSIVSTNPTMIKYILEFFILDCLMGLSITVINYNKTSVTVGLLGRIYRIVFGIIIIFGILFIWL